MSFTYYLGYSHHTIHISTRRPWNALCGQPVSSYPYKAKQATCKNCIRIILAEAKKYQGKQEEVT